MQWNLENLATEMAGIVLFRRVTEGPVLRALRQLADRRNASLEERADAYSVFLRELYAANGGNFSEYLEKMLLEDDNVYVRTVASGKTPSPSVDNCFRRELAQFSQWTALGPEPLKRFADLPANFPEYETEWMDLTVSIPEALKLVNRRGYGIFARYHMFRADESGRLIPVRSPDPVLPKDLIGYESERQRVMNNTLALLRGGPAANTLLCGDAGTGKSSTVKAIANSLRMDGLRLIELKKEQLTLLPEVMEQIMDNPLKFIIFVDDLSFGDDDSGYSALKAALEGSAAAKAPNAVIYATSNRRHLVKETFSAREGNDVHRRDTMEEMMSLSARFGLTILYSKPAKDLYLEIVHALAKEKGIDTQDPQLDVRAEAFALGRSGRSPRVAGQFIDSLLTETLT